MHARRTELGNVYYSLGQYMESAAAIESAITLSEGQSMQLWNNLALSYAAAQTFALAVRGI